jgi:hypothetical protein
VFEFPPDNSDHPKHLLYRLMHTFPELAEIRALDPKVAVIFRTVDKIKQNRMVLGSCHIPNVQGELRPLFELLLTDKLGFYPDFLIVLSKPYWDVASDLHKEMLCLHEALHMGQEQDKYGTPRFNLQTGEPVFGIQGHSIEEFDQIARRYGAEWADTRNFVAAVQEGESKKVSS